MGFTAIVAQVVLIRELLTSFSGNELAIGIFFANWLLLEALGSYGNDIGRSDLIRLGYEKALELYGEQYNTERIHAARKYLVAVMNNKLLVEDLELRIAEWDKTIHARKDRIISPFQTRDIKLIRTLKDHTGTVWSVKFSPDGRFLSTTVHLMYSNCKCRSPKWVLAPSK